MLSRNKLYKIIQAAV